MSGPTLAGYLADIPLMDEGAIPTLLDTIQRVQLHFTLVHERLSAIPDNGRSRSAALYRLRRAALDGQEAAGGLYSALIQFTSRQTAYEDLCRAGLADPTGADAGESPASAVDGDAAPGGGIGDSDAVSSPAKPGPEPSGSGTPEPVDRGEVGSPASPGSGDRHPFLLHVVDRERGIVQTAAIDHEEALSALRTLFLGTDEEPSDADADESDDEDGNPVDAELADIGRMSVADICDYLPTLRDDSNDLMLLCSRVEARLAELNAADWLAECASSAARHHRYAASSLMTLLRNLRGDGWSTPAADRSGTAATGGAARSDASAAAASPESVFASSGSDSVDGSRKTMRDRWDAFAAWASAKIDWTGVGAGASDLEPDPEVGCAGAGLAPATDERAPATDERDPLNDCLASATSLIDAIQRLPRSVDGVGNVAELTEALDRVPWLLAVLFEQLALEAGDAAMVSSLRSGAQDMRMWGHALALLAMRARRGRPTSRTTADASA
jgi:hypothetical protein